MYLLAFSPCRYRQKAGPVGTGSAYKPMRADFASDAYTLANETADGTTWWRLYRAWHYGRIVVFIFIITLYWKRDSAKWDSAKRDSAKRDSAKRDSAKRDSAKRDLAKRDSAKRDSAKRDSAKRDSAKRDSAKRDSAKRDSAKRDSAKRDSGETGFGETGFNETGFNETGFGETGFGETGFGETGQNPRFSLAYPGQIVRGDFFWRVVLGPELWCLFLPLIMPINLASWMYTCMRNQTLPV